MTSDLKGIITTQLFDINYPNIYALTETGHVVQVKPTAKQKKDPLFWRILEKIKNAKIWIPVSKTKHQLLEDDWLSVV
ncbi:hypothetical protein ACNAN0_00540 [Agrilactobacillus fermenti]|uniref:hypothetical protein n=1 Tax=Agrilactobacillus fermenti TaxID=2586909 RepID=UPI001E3DC0D5|nr:hypothetical protein [Agrilactobacillus fermenti]MCD2255576.1 hypothetical protein [Agrilactobacillus fermenti]